MRSLRSAAWWTRSASAAFDVKGFDPLGEAYLADPYPFLNDARRHAPAFFSELLDHWVVESNPVRLRNS